MACRTETSKEANGDCLEVEKGRQWFGANEYTWLAGQAIRYLNGADAEDERNYKHTIALLRAGEANTGALTQLAHDTSADPTLRWNVLHVLGDAGNASAGQYLAEAALEKLPDRQREGCEGPYDTELLNRTMAVHALAAVCGRHGEAVELLLRVAAARPDPAVLIEAVKAAVDLGYREKVQGLLAEEDRWILDIKRVGYREVDADSERADGKEVGFVPPKHPSEQTTPHACGCGGGER